MKQDEKYKQMKKRSRGYSACGVGCNIISYWADKKGNDVLSNMATMVGAAASAASIAVFIRSLEQYDADDTDKLYIDHLWNMTIMPVVDSLSLAYSLSSKEKKKQIINRLKGLL